MKITNLMEISGETFGSVFGRALHLLSPAGGQARFSNKRFSSSVTISNLQKII